jgi:hypothetical protein
MVSIWIKGWFLKTHGIAGVQRKSRMYAAKCKEAIRPIFQRTEDISSFLIPIIVMEVYTVVGTCKKLLLIVNSFIYFTVYY